MSPQAIGHTLTLVPLPGQLVVLGLLLGCGLWAARAKTRLALVAVLLCALFWLRANSHLEGMVLFSFSSAHGLTLADLLVPLVAAFVLTGQTERRKTNRERRIDGRVGGRRRDDPPAQPAHDAQKPDAQTSGAQSPGAQTPGAETPGAETPGAETPGAETPGAETLDAETLDLPRPRPAAHDQPAHDQPAHDQPAHDQPAHDERPR